MQDQFVVPQFLDVEAKIIGPITGRQFAILLVTGLFGFILYQLSPNLILTIILEVLLLAAGAILAFAKVNGMPIHYLILNATQTIKRPGLRVWDKSISDDELKQLMKEGQKEKKKAPERIQAKHLEASRLSELAMVVNTGGVYHPDDEKTISRTYGETNGQEEK